MWLFLRKYWYAGGKFLLTHPVWDVTPFWGVEVPVKFYFYSHIPCGMWLIHPEPQECTTIFLLTHPVWDVTWWPGRGNRRLLTFLLTHPVWDVTNYPKQWEAKKKFLLTHPVWDVTKICCSQWSVYIISTHTSRVGCDYVWANWVQASPHFYSHIPCGMWLCASNAAL